MGECFGESHSPYKSVGLVCLDWDRQEMGIKKVIGIAYGRPGSVVIGRTSREWVGVGSIAVHIMDHVGHNSHSILVCILL